MQSKAEKDKISDLLKKPRLILCTTFHCQFQEIKPSHSLLYSTFRGEIYCDSVRGEIYCDSVRGEVYCDSVRGEVYCDSVRD